jgi:hypothetical protein
MTLTKQDVRDVLAVYIRAWETRDPDLIVTIFTEDATYHERVLDAPIPYRDAIRRYWETKVVRDQANITCKLLNVYLDGNTAIAEWEAEFDDVAQGVRKRMLEIAVLDFEGRKIAALREYWSAERVGELANDAGVGEHRSQAATTRRANLPAASGESGGSPDVVVDDGGLRVMSASSSSAEPLDAEPPGITFGKAPWSPARDRPAHERTVCRRRPRPSRWDGPDPARCRAPARPPVHRRR